MEILSFARPFPLSFSPYPRARLRRFSSVSPMDAINSDGGRKGVAVLWFKQDLRLDDHPGLVAAAAQHRTILPLYVFDPRILSRFPDEMLELVLFAVKYLRDSLKEKGSNLMVRFGSAEYVIQEVVKEVKATNIFSEEDVEYDLRKMLDAVKETLATVPFLDDRSGIVLWQTPFYDIKNLKDLPASYADFKKLQVPLTSPLVCPVLPSVELEIDWGPMPAFHDLKKFMNGNTREEKGCWNLINGTSAGGFRVEPIEQVEPTYNLVEGFESLKLGKSRQSNSNCKHKQRKRSEKFAAVLCEGNSGGRNVALNALAAYLRDLEGTAQDDWSEVLENFLYAESQVGASYGALFGPAFWLGVISRRRVHYEAVRYEKERTARVSSVAAAAEAAFSMEWYRLMALKSQIIDEAMYSIRIWRWNGYLIQYTVVGDEGPAILLVHGFGAFLEHYRDNICGIANSRNRVWAITLLGFGKSEKPNIVYTELMWAELLRDFIIEVVGEQVHLVGNSIGGYIVSIAAGLWPDLAKSVVLINSAGNLNPGYSPMVLPKDRRTSGPAWLGARLLLLYLRLRTKSIVKKCYPTRTERADDWLIHEMLRASYDPGALWVLESIFSFNLSIPLNYLLEGFKDKVLIIQGMKDPISNSKSKIAMLREHCAGVVVKDLDAGHCPHDEKPEEVNSIISEWIVTFES
ncbi:uncharacterized protein LOC131146933 [Malania oleifera]|uniref:uncharacterized protein LOC131146933 n=1 Tax=Malania oleifera TaxID=397392 RepID=UPI0025AEA955|nr:uncharacterized protein LOC131146933 [Malania oleifera]